MSEPEFTLDDIRDRTQELVSLGTAFGKIVGGADGARAYLNDTLMWWLGIAIEQEGMAGACQLMEDARLATAHINRCDHGRCAS